MLRVGDEATVRLQPASFEHFYRAERESVFRALAVTLGNVDLAAEATDEAMSRAFQRWRAVSEYANPTGWVYRVAINWARSRFRKLRRESYSPPPEQSVAPQLTDPELIAAVQDLPMNYRTVVVLKYLLEWTQPEIAAALGISQGTVKSRLSRGVAMLKEAKGVSDEF